ncbi:molybdopterin-guanine dinucleotide biosynthesis protein B [Corallococcus sp. H22C18031201]|nr:molybdopterin-guanine dinucleotide biosynthesis protein B [Corallococcus sp. H22C18031201]
MSVPPALAVVGWSGAGKTTLLERLVPELSARGLRVAVVKHSSDTHPLHRPGSDTARFQTAGAALVGFATPEGVQLTRAEPLADTLGPLLAQLADTVDLVLVEGWKDGPLPKLEVWREGLQAPLAATRPEVLAVLTDAPAHALGPLAARRVAASDARAVADLVLATLKRGSAHGR